MMINDCFSYDLSTGVFTDGEYEVTNTIREIHHIFWPRTTDMTITFTAWGKNEPAAAFGFSIYELDELKCNDVEKSDNINTRKFGVQYEDPCGAVSDLGAQTFDEWGDKFIEYAKHTGQNIIVQPINWYSGPMFDSKTQPAALWYWLTLSNRQQYTVTSSKPDDWVSPFLDKCEAAGIDFIGGMTLLRLGNLLKNMNVDLDAIIDGHDTYNNMRFDNKVQASTNDWTLIYNALNLEKMIKEGKKIRSNENFEYVYGEKVDNFGAAPMFNPLHPEVQRQLIEYFEEISEKYGNKKAFKGVSINIWHATLVWYSSLSVGYDDYTIDLFAKETGIKIPCEEKDPERFCKRYEYLTRRNRNLWISWRCKKIHELILKLRDALRKCNPALNLYLCAWNEPVRRKMFGVFTESSQYPAFTCEDDFLKEGGIDLSLFAEDEGICLSVEQNQHRDRGWNTDGSDLPEEQRHFFHDLSYMDDSWRKVLMKTKSNGAFVMDSWEEGWGKHIFSPFNESNPDIDEALKKFKFGNITFHGETLKLEEDGFWFDSQRQITSCFPTGRNFLEPFAHAIAELDPLYLLRGGLYLNKSYAREMREYTSVFTKLPAIKFDLVNGNNDPVVVRELNIDDKFYFYAVNREPYEVIVKVKLENITKVNSLRTCESISADNGILQFKILPFSIDAFILDGNNRVTEYLVDIPQTETEEITRLYKKQLEVFDWLEKSDYNIAGADIIRNQLNIAYEGQKISKVRHILKSYVSSKARELFNNKRA